MYYLYYIQNNKVSYSRLLTFNPCDTLLNSIRSANDNVEIHKIKVN